MNSSDTQMELVRRYLGGEATLEETRKLESMLAVDAQLRRDYLAYARVEAGLSSKVRPKLVKTAPRRSVWLSWRPLAAAAAALVIFAVVVMWFRSPKERPGLGVAVLSSSIDAQWEGDPQDAGAVLQAGPLRIKSGAVLVEFYSGARVVVEGPAEFDLVSVSEAFLHSGKINAHVPPQARGFKVNSTGMKVVDHGTDFGFEVSNHAPPEVHVFKGNVEVASAGNAARTLNDGEALRLDAGTLNAIPAQRSSFMTEEELVRRVAADALKRFAAWREASRTLSADPATVIHYRFAAATTEGRSLKNETPQSLPETNGNIVGTSWTDGRWPGKRALAFRREGDRVRITASQPLHAVTFLAWVRVDSLPRGQNVLLAADSEQTGALHWLLTNRGELRLEIARDLGRSRADWEAVNSTPFVTPDQFGQWLLLATTFDGRTIRHYANGLFIGSGASFTPPALHIGTAELCNWSGGTQRQLNATLDEFVLLARVMNADEVRAVFEIGKP